MEPTSRLVAERDISRRAFLKFCALTASLLALPPVAARLLAEGLAQGKRLPVVWLSFQECTGCTESLTRSSAPSIEWLLFELISLDYHHTLQAASGAAAEAARETILKTHAGRLLVVVDGSVPTALGGACSTIAGEDNLSLLRRCLEAAEAVLAVGTCAGVGGLPAAAPNPTGAMGIGERMDRGLAPRLARRGAGPPADWWHAEWRRAAGALLELGGTGPLTHNACSTVGWNGVG